MSEQVTIAKAPALAPQFDSLGSSGLLRTGLQRGTVYEEFLPDLAGQRGPKIFREMRNNDPTIGAMFFAIENLIRQADWRIEGKNDQTAEFVTECLEDLSIGWGSTVTEILSMLTYGWSWFEVIYKRRVGPAENDPTKKSSFKDGKIGWRKFAPRSQDTLQEWVFDDDGEVSAMTQQAPPAFKLVEIPLSRSLLFNLGSQKGNPEGRSILRNAYRPWFFKRRIEDIEATGVERDLAGLPVIYRSPDMAAAYDAEFKRIIRNVRRDEQEGLILPLVYDEAGNKMLEFTLLSSAGSRQMNTTAIIDRYDKRIAMTAAADFLLLGQQAVGSFALASSKTALFATAIGTILKVIAEVMNQYAIPRLLAVNAMPLEDMPKMVPGDIETPDLAEVGAYVTALAGAGASLFPDDDLENHLRKIGDLPAKSEKSMAQPAPPAKAEGKPPVVPPTGEKPPVVPPKPSAEGA